MLRLLLADFVDDPQLRLERVDNGAGPGEVGGDEQAKRHFCTRRRFLSIRVVPLSLSVWLFCTAAAAASTSKTVAAAMLVTLTTSPVCRLINLAIFL